MSVETSERRLSIRTPAAYPVTLYDHRGRTLGRGSTGNISENGMLVIATGLTEVSVSDELALDIVMPADHDNEARERTIHRVCRVVRVRRLGELVGLGVECIDKQAR